MGQTSSVASQQQQQQQQQQQPARAALLKQQRAHYNGTWQQLPRPLHRVALLVGTTAYDDEAAAIGYATLDNTADELQDLQCQLEGDGFTCRVIESNSDSNTSADKLCQSLEQAAKELLATNDPATTLAVCYYSGHCAVDGSGRDCIVTACGELLPLSGSLQPLLKDVGWSVLLVDACRSAGVRASSSAGGLPFEVTFSTQQHYLVANACAPGTDADNGAFTWHLIQAWNEHKSVYEVVDEATQRTKAATGQRTEVVSSGGGEFRAFSFCRTLRQGNLWLNRSSAEVAMVGRDQELLQVLDNLMHHRLCVIEAGPGEGKTLLAHKAGLRCFYQGRYPAGAFCVDMRGCGSSGLGVQQHIAQQLTPMLKHASYLFQDAPDDWQSVLAWLRQEDQPTLLLLDNAEMALPSEDLSAAVEAMRASSTRVAVLLTSRRSELLHMDGGPAPVVKLEPLDEDDALQLLGQQQQLGDGERRQLVRHCQSNPLMLLFVASLLKHGKCTMQDILAAAAGGRPAAGLQRSRVLAPVLNTQLRQDQDAWWRDVLGAILTESELIALRRLSVFPNNFSTEGALALAPDLLNEELLSDLQDLTVLRPAGVPGHSYFVMHLLHREAAYQALAAESAELAHATARVVQHTLSLADKLGDLTPAQGSVIIQAESANLVQLVPWTKTTQPSAEDAGRLLKLSSRVATCGHLTLAEPLARQGLAIVQLLLGYKHPDTASSLNNLAILLSGQGMLAEAEPLYRQALAIRQEVLGPKHPDIASSLNNLANLLRDQGKLAEAEPLYRQALAIMQEVLGPKHPDTASSLNNLAILLSGQGMLAEAEPLYRQALAIRQELLGPKHPDTASSLNNLAILLSGQGMLAEAEPLYRQALAIRQELLGPKHPDTASSFNNLAILLSNQGKLDEAEPLYRQALAIRQEVLGPKHPDTASSLNNLAILLRQQGKLDETEPLYRQALAIRQRVLGPKHPDTASSIHNLGNMLRGQGKFAEAESLYCEALAIKKQVLPAKHPDIASSLNNLAILLSAEGMLDEESGPAGACSFNDTDFTQAAAAAAAIGDLQARYTAAMWEESLRQQLTACSTGMLLLSGAWLVNLPQEQGQHCANILARQGYMQLTETEDSLLLCSPKGVQSLQRALMEAELQAHRFRGDESSNSRLVDDDEQQQQSQGSRWSWSSWLGGRDGNSGAGGQRGQDPADQGGADQGPPDSSGPGSGQQGQGSPASALPADKCVLLSMASHPWPDSGLGSTCRPTEVQTSSTTGDMMVAFRAWNKDVQLGVQLHMEACVKHDQQGTKLGFKLPRINALAEAPPGATASSSSRSQQQLYFMHKVKLSLEVQQPNGIRISDTVGKNHQRSELHTGTVQTVIMYKFKETTVSTNITASANPSGTLSVSTVFKEAPIAPISGSQLPLVTYHPAQREIKANFGHGSKPCSFEIIRQPIYSMLCGDDADLGSFNSNPFNRRDEKELCFEVQEVNREWLGNDGLHVKLALLALGAHIKDDMGDASKIVKDVKHVEYFHMCAGAIIKLGEPLQPVKTSAGCNVHT